MNNKFSTETLQAKTEPKKEVNRLLAELGRPKKYEVA